MFCPGSGSEHLFGSYMKSGMQTYFFLASYGFRSKVLVLVIVEKLRDPGTGAFLPPESGIRIVTSAKHGARE
jgi:hypothetical protein